MKKNVQALSRAMMILFTLSLSVISCSKEKISTTERSSTKAGPILEELMAGKTESAGRWLTLVNVCKRKVYKITYKAELFPTGTVVYAYFANTTGDIVAKKSFTAVIGAEATVSFASFLIPPTATKIFLSTFNNLDTLYEDLDAPCGERPETDYENAYVTPYDCVEPC
jgi:hypothetical protein